MRHSNRVLLVFFAMAICIGACSGTNLLTETPLPDQEAPEADLPETDLDDSPGDAEAVRDSSLPATEDAGTISDTDSSRFHVTGPREDLCAEVALRYGIVIYRWDRPNCDLAMAFCTMVRTHNGIRPDARIRKGTKIEMPPAVEIFERMGLDDKRMAVVRQVLEAYELYYGIEARLRPLVRQERADKLVKEHGDTLKLLVRLIDTLGELDAEGNAKKGAVPRLVMHNLKRIKHEIGLLFRRAQGDDVYIGKTLGVILTRFALAINYLNNWALKHSEKEGWRSYVAEPPYYDKCQPNEGAFGKD